jgi:hypothetical protein
MKRNIFSILFMMIVLLQSSCKKFIELQPTDKTTSETVFDSPKNAENAVNGMYANLSLQGNIFSTRLYTDISLLGDELKTTNTASTVFAENNLTSTSAAINSFWTGLFAMIYHSNLVIDKLPTVPGINENQLKGWTAEAKFLRAWSYFYAVQLFGPLPKVTTSAWKDNVSLKRLPVTEIYSLIAKDLEEAEKDLPHDYANSEKDRIRATKGAAKALSVKYFMLTKNWAAAEAKATELVNDSAMYNLKTSFADVFKPNSTESVLELWFGEKTPNGAYNAFFFGARAQYSPSTKIISAFNASTGDTRSAVTISGGKVNKYPSNTARTKLLRMGDIYLLRAEARAQQNKLSESADDLNRIRSRAGLPATTAISKDDLLLAIEKERFLELAFEGQRWFDLVRTGKATEILSALKGTNWQTTDVLLPVPQTEIGLNPGLLPQNPGY